MRISFTPGSSYFEPLLKATATIGWPTEAVKQHCLDTCSICRQERLLNAWKGVLMRAQLNRDDRPIEAFLTVTIEENLKP